MKKILEVLANIVRSFLTYLSVGVPGFFAFLLAYTRTPFFSGRIDFLPRTLSLMFDSILIYAALAILSMLTGHIIASGWNKTAGYIVASMEYLYSGVLIWSQLGNHRLCVIASMLLVYALAGFLFVKLQKKTGSKFTRIFYRWGSLIIPSLLLVGYFVCRDLTIGAIFPMFMFVVPGGLTF